MYDELVKRLREADEKSMCGECGLNLHTGATKKGVLFAEAADAIEELQADKDALNGTVTNLLEQIKDLCKPRWIPVTERLPEAKRKVLVATFHGGVYYGFMESRGKFYTANNTLADSWCWEPDVTHWMPLPQPPKEEP